MSWPSNDNIAKIQKLLIEVCLRYIQLKLKSHQAWKSFEQTITGYCPPAKMSKKIYLAITCAAPLIDSANHYYNFSSIIPVQGHIF